MAGPAAARPHHPHPGLAAAPAGQVPRVRRVVHLPDGRRQVWRSGWSSGSTTATSTLSAHDLLQELKTHPKIRPLLEGGERLEWGAKTIPGGGFHALPTRFHAPGLLLCGDGAGMVNVPTLKGIHYAIESGRLAAEAAFAAVRDAGEGVVDACARVLRRRGEVELHLERSARGARHAPRVRAGLLRSARPCAGR